MSRMQIFGLHSDGTPRMNGFVDNYMRQPANGTPLDPRAVMHCFTPEQLPVLSTLARSFGVSDRWFSSVPSETWPNRLFAHAGSSGGAVDNTAIPLPFLLPSVFRRLESRGRSWKVYFHDAPQTASLVDLWLRIPTHFRFFDPEFLEDAADGRLAELQLHRTALFHEPPAAIAYRTTLTRRITWRLPSNWSRRCTMLSRTARPGIARCSSSPSTSMAAAMTTCRRLPRSPTGRPASNGFAFDRFGPRVPAVIVSPYVPAGSIHPATGQADHHSTIHRSFQR